MPVNLEGLSNLTAKREGEYYMTNDKSSGIENQIDE